MLQDSYGLQHGGHATAYHAGFLKKKPGTPSGQQAVFGTLVAPFSVRSLYRVPQSRAAGWPAVSSAMASDPIWPIHRRAAKHHLALTWPKGPDSNSSLGRGNEYI